MRRRPHRYAPDPRARWIWLFATVVAGGLAWLLDSSAPTRAGGPAVEGEATRAPVEEVDVVWVPSAAPPDAGAASGEGVPTEAPRAETGVPVETPGTAPTGGRRGGAPPEAE